MKKMLESLREASRQAIEEAVDMDSLEALRVRYLGKKGELTAILKDPLGGAGCAERGEGLRRARCAARPLPRQEGRADRGTQNDGQAVR